MDITQADLDRALRISRWYRRRVARRSQVADLDGAALEGLARAARRYDGSGDFWSFAFPHLKGAMRDELRRIDHLTRSARQQVVRGTDELSEPDYVLDLVGRKVDATEPLPLDAALATATEKDVAHVALTDTELGYERVEVRDAVWRILRAMPARTRFVVLASVSGYPNVLIGRLLGVTEGRTSQIRTAAYATLRAELAPTFADAA